MFHYLTHFTSTIAYYSFLFPTFDIEAVGSFKVLKKHENVRKGMGTALGQLKLKYRYKVKGIMYRFGTFQSLQN